MKKTDLERLISLYVDGDLGPRQAVAVSNLIQSNEAAGQIYLDYLRLRDMFKSLPVPRLPEGFSTRVLDRIRDRYPDGKVPRGRSVFILSRGRRVVLAILSGATAVLLVGFACLWIKPASTTNDFAAPLARVVSVKEGSHSASVVAPTASPAPDFVPTPPAPLSLAPSRMESLAVPAGKPVLLQVALNPDRQDRFPERFLKVCGEQGLSFKKSTHDGHENYTFRVEPAQFTFLLVWLSRQTDVVRSLELPEPLAHWEEGDSVDAMFGDRDRISITVSVDCP